MRPSPAITNAWISIMRTQQLLLGAIERALKAENLPPLGWYDVLLELSRAENDRLRPFEIEERTLMAQHNLSRLLDRMEKAELVEREVYAQDARGRWVILTAQGRTMQAAMWRVYAAALQRHIGDKIDDRQAEQLCALMSPLTVDLRKTT
nr:helix-turn-helix domain-containing protein [Xaviernesmea rhizosphaerae]